MSSASLYYTPSTTTTTTTAAKPHTASTKRRVRFTFGYSSRTPSFGSLPPSPTTDRIQNEPSISSTTSSPSSTLLTSTSLPIMHMPTPIDTISIYNRPTADDLTAMMIPARTSSITSTTSISSTLTPSSSRPTSKCSSINSGFSYNGSLDHRTMRSTPSSGHKSTSSISSSITMPAPAAPISPALERPSPPASPVAPPPPSGRRPSVIERSAFLASAPVRSRAQIYPRLKNMCPAPSTTLGTATTTFFTNASLPSLTTRCFSGFQTNSSSCCLMNLCGVSLEKRRWSNDSTRGLYGSSSSGTLSFLSNDDGRTSTSSTISSSGESTLVEENDGGADTKTKGGRRDKKKPKKAKKPCASLALFSFMLKK